jgi:hypothetical protein
VLESPATYFLLHPLLRYLLVRQYDAFGDLFVVDLLLLVCYVV